MSANTELFEQMKQTVDGFRAHTLPLSDVIERLPQLLSRAEGIDEEWREEYISCWWTLEQVHGEAIDLGEATRMPRGSRDTVDDAIDGLRKLIDSALVAN